MKRSYILSIIVVISIIAISILFLYGNVVLQIYGTDQAPRTGPYSASDDGPTEETGGSGSAETGKEETEEITDETGCRTQQIHYSLKKFVNDIKCTNTIAEKCVELFANCSVDVYNLDSETSGTFEIEYSLINSNERETDSKTIQRNVTFNDPQVFSAIFSQSSLEGVDENLNCSFTMQTIPTKTVCH